MGELSWRVWEMSLRVEYAVGVWAELHGLPRFETDLLEREVAALATRTTLEAVKEESPPPRSRRVTQLGDFQVSYELDLNRRVLTVLSVRRHGSAAR